MMRSTNNLALLFASAFLAATVRSEDASLLHTYQRLIHNLFLRSETHQTANDNSKEKQPLLVIGAGLGRTSTSSFVKALARLGGSDGNGADGDGSKDDPADQSK